MTFEMLLDVAKGLPEVSIDQYHYDDVGFDIREDRKKWALGL